jgi:hypothetical protein
MLTIRGQVGGTEAKDGGGESRNPVMKRQEKIHKTWKWVRYVGDSIKNPKFSKLSKLHRIRNTAILADLVDVMHYPDMIENEIKTTKCI